jgi:hypothetical protein
MLNPKDVLDDLVNLLKAMPDLVTAMDGDADKIYAFNSEYPLGVNFQKALYEMKSPGIMVRYRSPGNASVGYKFSHSLSIYLKPQAGDTYEDLFNALMNETPTSSPVAFQDSCINEDLDPMRFTFSEPIPDEEGVEYLEIRIDTDER